MDAMTAAMSEAMAARPGDVRERPVQEAAEIAPRGAQADRAPRSAGSRAGEVERRRTTFTLGGARRRVTGQRGPGRAVV